MRLPNPLPLSMLQTPPEELWACIESLGNELETRSAELKQAYEKLHQVETISRKLEAVFSRLDQLEAENADLKAQLNQPIKTSENSSLPPSTQVKASISPSRSPNTKRQRGGKSRRRQMADVVVECQPELCQQCGADLSASERHEIGRQQVIELPPMRAVVMELVRYRRRCGCGHCQEDRYPKGYDAPHQVFGPGLHALISYFNGSHHLAHDRLQQMLKDVFGVEISAGALVNSLQYTARQLQPAAQTILETIRHSPVVGSDETGLRLEGKNGWLWVMQTPQASYFAAVGTRSGQVLQDLIGDNKIEVWVSDLYAGQLMAPAQQFAVCNAHQLRDLQYAIDAGDRHFAPAMQSLLREALQLTHLRSILNPLHFQAESQRLKTYAQRLVEIPTEHKVARRLQKRFRKHFDKIWLFLDDERVPFENNASERALRPSVVHRNVIGGFRSLNGAAAYARYRTLEDTARKQQQNIFDALFSALGKPLDLPLLLASYSST